MSPLAEYWSLSTLTGKQVVSLMRKHKVTIRDLAKRAGATQIRVRQIREQGVKGYCDVTSWLGFITGTDPYRREVREAGRAHEAQQSEAARRVRAARWAQEPPRWHNQVAHA